MYVTSIVLYERHFCESRSAAHNNATSGQQSIAIDNILWHAGCARLALLTLR